MILGYAILMMVSATVGSDDFVVSVTPLLSIPVGPSIEGENLQLFSVGGGVGIKGDFIPSFAPFLYGRLSGEMWLSPLNKADSSLTFIFGGGNGGLYYNILPWLAVKMGGGGGMYLALSDFGMVRNPYAEGGLELDFRLGPALTLRLGGTYKYLFTPTVPLYEGFTAQVGISYDLKGSKKGRDLQIDHTLKPVFPLFYSHYDKNPIGEIILINKETLPLEKVKVSFYVKQYMDTPRSCSEIKMLPAGGKERLPLFALFNDSIFKVTEGTKVAGEIIVEYLYIGSERKIALPVTVQIYNRNALTWDDDRKVAAFITAKDPVVQRFAKNVIASTQKEVFPIISENFRNAFALFQALSAHNMSYSVDPQTPYHAYSNTEEKIDYLQFPVQTLAYRAGDCDDLSVLYASLLESVGIPTALITIPGHIYVAFDCGLSPEKAEKLFDIQNDVLIRDNTVWIPVEITLIKEGFVRSWRIGLQEWAEAKQAGTEGFYLVRDAWKIYEPIGFLEGSTAIPFPSSEEVVEKCKKEVLRFFEMYVKERVLVIQKEGERSKLQAEQIANRKGIVYAQFGFLDKAIEQFKLASQKGNYPPALTNLGNVMYLKGDMEGALQQYQAALRVMPDSVPALLGAARCFYSLGALSQTNEIISKIKKINPNLSLSVELADATVPKIRASESFNAMEGQLWDE